MYYICRNHRACAPAPTATAALIIVHYLIISRHAPSHLHLRERLALRRALLPLRLLVPARRRRRNRRPPPSFRRRQLGRGLVDQEPPAHEALACDPSVGRAHRAQEMRNTAHRSADRQQASTPASRASERAKRAVASEPQRSSHECAARAHPAPRRSWRGRAAASRGGGRSTQ
eukprot:COSAG05_NODE_8481_length_699_cov_1.430000_2_plen_173_part_00